VTRENLSREYSKAEILSTRKIGISQGGALQEGQLLHGAGTYPTIRNPHVDLAGMPIYAQARMKLWFKYLLGIIFGLALYAVVPRPLLESGGLFAVLAETAARIGFYCVGAYLFSALVVAIPKLFEEKRFWRLFLKGALFYLASLFAASGLGILASMLFLPLRIPFSIETQTSYIPVPANLQFSIFPMNLVSLAVNAHEYLLPLMVFAFVLGLAIAHDPMAARPVYLFFDSISRIFHNINTFIIELLPVLLIPMTARALFDIEKPLSLTTFGSFVTVLALCTGFFLFIVIPAAFYFLSGKQNPLKSGYAILGAALASLISGNMRFSLGTTIYHVRENFGLKRRYNALFFTEGVFLGRAGTAFVSAVSFAAILSSYSRLGIPAETALWLLIFIPIATIIASAGLQNGPIVVLAILSSYYGKGFENGYLIMIPAMAMLAMVANLLDTVWLSFSTICIAHREIEKNMKPLNHII